jgi:hypothetical protein
MKKNMNFKKIYFILIILTILVVSCKKDNEATPDYVGTWVAYYSMNGDSIKDIMTFTSNSFNRISQTIDSTGKFWTSALGIKGSISVKENAINITITQFGLTTIDVITQRPTGTIVYYKEGDSVFDNIMAQSSQPKTFVSLYSISANKLTLKTDNYNDGNYTDPGDVVIYTKQ